ncbi:MAG: hemolysin family protein [Micrococcaceae bacterium]
MSSWMGIFWLVILLAGNAFFVGAEFAVMSARRSQIEPLAEDGNKRAKKTLWAIEHVSLMLACAQLGITVCSLLILNVAEPSIHHLLADPLIHLGVQAGLADGIAFAIALAVVTLLHVILGEMVPKNISVSFADKAALWLAPPLVALSKLVKPLIVVLNWAGNLALKIIGVQPKDELTSAYTLEEMESIVQQSTKHGTVVDSGGLLAGAIEFSRLNAAQSMVPLADVATLPMTVTPEEFEKKVAETGFSRFPLTNTQNEIVGYLHLKDVLGKEASDKYEEPINTKRIRLLVNIPATVDVEDALESMQRSGSHLGRVVDASGRTIGVLFLEDVLEQLVGEIRDVTQKQHT